MDFELNFLEVGAAAAIVYGMIYAERFVRRRRLKNAEAAAPPRVPSIKTPIFTGRVEGAASSTTHVCGHRSKNFSQYAGGVTVCEECINAGMIPCSCGHISADGKIYPNGTILCVSCSATYDTAESKRLDEERVQVLAQRAKHRENLVSAVADKLKDQVATKVGE